MFTLTITGSGLAPSGQNLPTSCVVRAGAVPYKAVQMVRGWAFWPFEPAEETVDAVEESRRRPMGLGSKRAVGLRPAIGGAEAARSCRPSAPWSGPASAAVAG